MDKFVLKSEYQPCGDQPQAIKELTQGIEDGLRTQVLLGVTGSGKTFTMANVIQNIQRPTLVIAHNKTLAAQLCNEFREFFPNNAVEFFVSYYDYFQPEAYIPRTGTYIEKELEINDEIDRLRNSATCSLCERRDVIVVASVSCIYGLGAPMEYYGQSLSLREGMQIERDEIIHKLVAIQYKRAEFDFLRATFRVRGDMIDIFPANYSERAVRVEMFGDTVEKIYEIDLTTGKKLLSLTHINIFPASHYVISREKMERTLLQINSDMLAQSAEFLDNGKFIEAQRIKERVLYDLEMIKEIGYCSGIENYSRYFDGREPGQPPYTLLDFFPKDFVCFVDESHMTLPQIRAMFNGDLARKRNLIDYGFRLQAAYDNRPLRFSEWNERIGQIVCVSATPAEYELKESSQNVEQLIRPTGLIDPEITLKPTTGQIDDLIGEINKVTAKGGRVLVTTLTKKMSESLTRYLAERDIKVKYMHSEIVTLERIEIIQSLRKGEFDALVGINLLREGLDIPEVQLVCILDADKEGFLRSDTSLIQTIGRAARNSEARVIMYADNITGSMRRAIDETNRRREKQIAHNVANNITPTTIIKPIKNTIEISKKIVNEDSPKEILSQIERIKGLMSAAAGQLDFENAIKYRNEISILKKKLKS